MESSKTTTAGVQRRRARQACVTCNARRVKCNVTVSRPCHNCATANIPCETRESRRGKHERRRRPSEPGSTTQKTTPPKEYASEITEEVTEPGALEDRPSVSSNEDDAQESNIFLGESSSLGYTAQPPMQRRLIRHAVPNAVKADALVPEWEQHRRRSRLESLKRDGVFSLPEKVALEGLLTAYFQWFHPCFAIVDEPQIWRQYQEETLSPLLLQALLFIGVLHCDESILKLLNLGPRHKAKYSFYNRAKDIYDADYERSKLTVVQALFLMSFWRGGALVEKDVRHWLGAAISLAQSQALHRGSGRAKSPLIRLRRRLWWAIYTRERQCAAGFGLPHRIRDEDCDVSALERSDFEGAFATDVAEDLDRYISYSLCITDLATFLGKIVHVRFLPKPRPSPAYRTHIRDQLTAWKERLPPILRVDDGSPRLPSFHGNMITLAYNNLLILLFRSDYSYMIGDPTKASPDGELCLEAAVRNSRIVEQMLLDNTLRHGQMHVITCIFNTLCIHTIHIRYLEGHARTIIEQRAKLCLLGLQELQKTWDVTNWILQLFFKYLDRTMADRLRVPNQTLQPGASAAATREPSVAPSEPNAQEPTNQAEELQPPPPPAPPDMAHEFPDGTTAVLDLDIFGNPPNAGNGWVGGAGSSNTPWSWTTEEADNVLFSHIENGFTLGGGGMGGWDQQLLQPDLEGFL